MAAGGMNASPTSPDTSGYSGPAPVFGGGTPFLNPVGGGTPPSMTPTPPINPTPAPPQPQMQPAVMPPYGGPQRGPGSSFGGDMDFFGRRGGYENLPPDRMPQFGRFGGFGGFDPFAGFGFLRSNRGPATPTWSQQGGVYNYNPNGRPEGMANPMIGNMMDRFAQKQQMLQDRVAQQRQAIADQVGQALPQGLGAINPFKPQG